MASDLFIFDMMRHSSYIKATLAGALAVALMAFSSGTARRTLVVREWMSDAYYQIRPTFFTYDAQGRLIRTESQNPDTFVVTNTYTPNSIISVTQISSSPRIDTIIYQLNSAGLIIADNHDNHYTYNSDGKLIKGALDDTYTWDGGDMATHTYTNGNGTHVIAYVYTNIPDTRDHGDAAWGFHSEHLVLSESDPPNTITHKYLFDDQGRVVTDSAGANIYHYFY